MHLFCHKKNLRTFFYRENDLRVFFVAKMIYALRPESFCALEVAIRKVETFWASGNPSFAFKGKWIREIYEAMSRPIQVQGKYHDNLSPW